jgi:hypothetical protein
MPWVGYLQITQRVRLTAIEQGRSTLVREVLR